jgi:hypothetical protein
LLVVRGHCDADCVDATAHRGAAAVASPRSIFFVVLFAIFFGCVAICGAAGVSCVAALERWTARLCQSHPQRRVTWSRKVSALSFSTHIRSTIACSAVLSVCRRHGRRVVVACCVSSHSALSMSPNVIDLTCVRSFACESLWCGVLYCRASSATRHSASRPDYAHSINSHDVAASGVCAILLLATGTWRHAVDCIMRRPNPNPGYCDCSGLLNDDM